MSKRKSARLATRVRAAARRTLRAASAGEMWKNALIVLLTASAVFLSTRTGLFDLSPAASSGGSAAALETGALPVDGAVGYTAAAEPFTIVVTPEVGSHYAAIYDQEALDALYSQFSAALGEALGSSGEPEAVEEAEWREALRGDGIYFDFYSDQPLSVLAGWLGTAISGGAANHTARRICLSGEDGRVVLYYIRAREGEGTAYRCSTALSWSVLEDSAEEYLPNGAEYNFELDRSWELVDPYAVILAQQPAVRSVSARAPELSDGEKETLLSVLGMNSYLAEAYTETDGTEVWIEGNDTLRLDPNGVSTFTRTGFVDGGETLSAAQMIEYVRSMLEGTVGSRCGDGRLYLSYIAYDPETEEYTLRFEYRVEGLTVTLGAGLTAARIVFKGREISDATLVFREYALGEGTEKPLPPVQAAAVVQSLGGGEPVLSYVDDFNTVSASWLIK